LEDRRQPEPPQPTGAIHTHQRFARPTTGDTSVITNSCSLNLSPTAPRVLTQDGAQHHGVPRRAGHSPNIEVINPISTDIEPPTTRHR
jgi:hypothetical protein